MVLSQFLPDSLGGSRLPVILQAEQSECGLACLAMVLNFHGHRIDLNTLRARLGSSQQGLTLTALVFISMDRHTPDRFSNFEARIAELPEVLECLLITGQAADYQLKVIVRDMDAYQDLLLNKITRIDGVTGVHSSFVLRRAVDKTALPVGMP